MSVITITERPHFQSRTTPFSVPAEDFSKEIAKHFGFTRVTQKTAQLCEAGVQHLIAEQTILLEDGSYKIAE